MPVVSCWMDGKREVDVWEPLLTYRAEAAPPQGSSCCAIRDISPAKDAKCPGNQAPAEAIKLLGSRAMQRRELGYMFLGSTAYDNETDSIRVSDIGFVAQQTSLLYT